MSTVGSRIRELRTKKGLSLEELADQLNDKHGTSINKGMISKWENNITDPKLDHIRPIALFFNTSLDYLLGINEDINSEVNTLAAHFEGEEFTKDELDEIRDYINYLKTKRKEK